MKIEGYEEISGKEWEKIQEDKRAMFVPMDKNHIHYFKKAQKFPIVLENENYKIDVLPDALVVYDKGKEKFFTFQYNISFALLVKAVEKAKEVMKKK